MMRTLALLILALGIPGPAGAQEAWNLLRAPSAGLARDTAPGPGIELDALPVEATWVWNSGLPRSSNDGALWAGRGSNLLLRTGFTATWGPVRLALAPELTYSQNLPFPVFPSPDGDRSPFASPWHNGVHSLDLPLRFGVDDRLTVGPGQSSLQVVWRNVAAGFATENLWWGPGIRNALVLSNHAPGFPHVFLRTRAPFEGDWGAVEGAWIAGTLTESLYFDRDPANDHRSLAGLAVVYRPPVEDDLALGLARVVVRPLDGAARSPLRLPDALLRWNDRPVAGGDGTGSDHVTSVFLRWAPSGTGLDLFAEWAWTELPGSLEELLTTPHDGRGYTLGLQWTRPVADGARSVRVEVEATNLERALSRRDGDLPPDFYAGSAAPHGFTHRGQLLGAAVGPGGQSQWLAVDVIDGSWSVGATFSRIRWEDDALFRQQSAHFWRHDLSLAGGLRGSWRTAGVALRAEAILGKRHNYLFQNGFTNPAGVRTVDVPNHTISLSVVRAW